MVKEQKKPGKQNQQPPKRILRGRISKRTNIIYISNVPNKLTKLTIFRKLSRQNIIWSTRNKKRRYMLIKFRKGQQAKHGVGIINHHFSNLGLQAQISKKPGKVKRITCNGCGQIGHWLVQCPANEKNKCKQYKVNKILDMTMQNQIIKYEIQWKDNSKTKQSYMMAQRCQVKIWNYLHGQFIRKSVANIIKSNDHFQAFVKKINPGINSQIVRQKLRLLDSICSPQIQENKKRNRRKKKSKNKNRLTNINQDKQEMKIQIRPKDRQNIQIKRQSGQNFQQSNQDEQQQTKQHILYRLNQAIQQLIHKQQANNQKIPGFSILQGQKALRNNLLFDLITKLAQNTYKNQQQQLIQIQRNIDIFKQLGIIVENPKIKNTSQLQRRNNSSNNQQSQQNRQNSQPPQQQRRNNSSNNQQSQQNRQNSQPPQQQRRNNSSNNQQSQQNRQNSQPPQQQPRNNSSNNQQSQQNRQNSQPPQQQPINNSSNNQQSQQNRQNSQPPQQQPINNSSNNQQSQQNRQNLQLNNQTQEIKYNQVVSQSSQQQGGIYRPNMTQSQQQPSLQQEYIQRIQIPLSIQNKKLILSKIEEKIIPGRQQFLQRKKKKKKQSNNTSKQSKKNQSLSKRKEKSKDKSNQSKDQPTTRSRTKQQSSKREQKSSKKEPKKKQSKKK